MNRLLLSATLLCLGLASVAQVKPTTKQPVALPVAKWKPPVVKTYLAKFNGINTVCTVEEAKNAILLPLRITDAKNNAYAISSYQLAYKRQGVKEDENGVVTPATDLVAQLFTETPFTGIWKDSILEQLKKGEELYFFDVIVTDGKGHRFFAPDLKLTTQ